MKKMLFGLIATVMLSFTGNAQDIVNKKNPYDKAGAQHNEVVREFIKKYSSEQLSFEKTIEVTNNICKSKGITDGQLTVKMFNNGIIDIKNNFKETVNKSSLSSEGKLELQKLFDFMLNNGFNGGVSFDESISFILNFEENVLKNNKLIKSDIEFLLKSASVGRYSVCLWKDYYGDIKSKETENNSIFKTNWVKWLIIGAADIAGGVAGGGAFSVASGATASTLTIGVIEKAK